jgi:hypothetical protein
LPLPYPRLTDDFFTNGYLQEVGYLCIFKKVYEGRFAVRAFLGYGMDF